MWMWITGHPVDAGIIALIWAACILRLVVEWGILTDILEIPKEDE